MSQFVMVTGLSGAGRSTAAATLEDTGWFVIDNLPAALVPKVVELAGRPGVDSERIALVVGRGGAEHGGDVAETLRWLTAQSQRSSANSVRVLFLDAPDEVLVRRYEGTRRRHPMGSRGVEQSIGDERKLLASVRDAADIVLDTGELNVHQLRARVIELFAGEDTEAGMQTSILTFGYKHGIPLDADVMFDCRFLPNPYWSEELRASSGLDPAVREFVLGQPEVPEFLDRVDELITMLRPGFLREGKAYLTVALGCTGGRHRSVAIAEALRDRLAGHGLATTTFHRDIER